MGNNLFQFGRGKLIHLDQGALYRELKELVLSVSREGGGVFRLQRHGGGGVRAWDPGFHEILADYPT